MKRPSDQRVSIVRPKRLTERFRELQRLRKRVEELEQRAKNDTGKVRDADNGHRRR
jgi:hypothetical protein